MLIEEIVSKQNLKEFKYDPTKVKNVKYDNVDYTWDKILDHLHKKEQVK